MQAADGKEGSASEMPASPELRVGSVPLKYVVLVLLVLQNSMTAILARASRVPATPGQQLYLGSVAVFAAEVIKLPICIGLIARDAGGLSPMLAQLWDQVILKWRDTLLMGVPVSEHAASACDLLSPL